MKYKILYVINRIEKERYNDEKNELRTKLAVHVRWKCVYVSPGKVEVLMRNFSITTNNRLL
jgi:hypothetical protein